MTNAGLALSRNSLVLSRNIEVLRSDSFFGRSATHGDIVARLPTFSAGFLDVEWAHNFHMSLLVAVGTVLMIIDR